MKVRFPRMFAAVVVFASALVSSCGGGSDGEPVSPPRFEGALETDDPGRFGSFIDYPALTEFTAIALEDGTMWFTRPNLGVGQAKFSTGRPKFSVDTGKVLEYRYLATDVHLGNPARLSAGPSTLVLEYGFRVLSESTISLPLGYNFARFIGEQPGPPKILPNSRYDYQKPASITEISGNWGQSFAITASGQILTTAIPVKVGGAFEFGMLSLSEFTVETTTICNLTGTVVPRPSGKNVFNVNLSASGNGCAIAGQSYNGVAVPYLDKTNAPRLQIMTLNAGKNSYASLSLQRGDVL